MVVLHKQHHVLLNLRQCDSHGQVLRTRTRKPSLGSSRKNAKSRAIFGVAMRLAPRAKTRDSLTKQRNQHHRGLAIIADSPHSGTLPSRTRNHRGLATLGDSPLADSQSSWTRPARVLRARRSLDLAIRRARGLGARRSLDLATRHARQQPLLFSKYEPQVASTSQFEPRGLLVGMLRVRVVPRPRTLHSRTQY